MEKLNVMPELIQQSVESDSSASNGKQSRVDPPLEGRYRDKPPKRRLLVAFLPNFITICSLFTALIAIVKSMQGNLMFASYCIVASMILDGMDGRVARITNSFSKFGEELDSLCDVVAFGIAPAIFAYSWYLAGMDKIGWAAMFIYVACTALRLARFNSMLGIQDSRFFCGLPSPAAAANVITFYWFIVALQRNFTGISYAWVPYVLWLVVVLTGLSMISNVLFTSLKKIRIVEVYPQTIAIVAMLLLVALLLNHRLVMFLIIYTYWVGGSLWYFYRQIPRFRSNKIEH